MKKKQVIKLPSTDGTLRSLPRGWQWVRLQDLASSDPRAITDGPFGSNLKSEHYTTTGPRVVRLENIGHGSFIDKPAHISQAHYERLSRHAISAGDLVIAILGSPLPRACRIPESLGPAIVKADCIRFQADPALVDGRYACWWINSTEPQKAAEDSIHGVGRPRLGMDNVKGLLVPLAPRPEQARIVAKIDELFSDIEAGEKALERAELLVKRYRQSVLKAAVTGELTKDWRSKNLARLKKQKKTGADLLADILKKRRLAWETSELAKLTAKGKAPKDDKWKSRYVEPAAPKTDDLPNLPEGWVWARLDAIAVLAGGVTVDKGRKPKDPTTLPYLRVANVQRGFLALQDVKEITVEADDARDLILCEGDVLFTEGGDRDKLGRGWVWHGELPRCIHQNHIFRARPFSVNLFPEFISHHGNVIGPKYFSDEGKQTTNLASIGLSKLRSFPIPIPPDEELHQVMSALERMLSIADHQINELAIARSAASALKQSILKSAFSGKLVAQDSADESAAVLLDRIKAEHAKPHSAPVKVRKQPASSTARRARGRPKKATESRDRQGKLL